MAISFEVPNREEVSENNKAIFDQLEKGLGFVPNLYATYAYSNTALAAMNSQSSGEASHVPIV